MIPNIKECNRGHCALWFPQFKKVIPSDLVRTIKRVIEDANDPQSYFRLNYKNWEPTVEVLVAARPLIESGKVVEGCELIYSFRSNEHIFMERDWYIDLRGEVAEFLPCCR